MITRTVQNQLEKRVVTLVESHRLGGVLNVPKNAKGAVIFAHGSGSGRFSPRNQFVANLLREAGLATFLFDLLDEEEAEDREKVFDVSLLAERLLHAANWLKSEPETSSLPLGLFGASTGAGAALVAAARHPSLVRAVVSRGGRADLAATSLPAVQAPTLLIVGGNDDEVLQLNRESLRQLHCVKELKVIPGATHLFEEAGALEEVSRLAKGWFMHYLVQPSTTEAKLDRGVGVSGLDPLC